MIDKVAIQYLILQAIDTLRKTQLPHHSYMVIIVTSTSANIALCIEIRCSEICWAKPPQQENRKLAADFKPPEPQQVIDEYLALNHPGMKPSPDASPDDSVSRSLGSLLGRSKSRRNIVANKFDDLHPFTQILSLSNLDACVALENDTFPEHERCSKEKFLYRLTKCPELSLGLFSIPSLTSFSNASAGSKADLVAHIIATRTPALSVTDASMGYPTNWRTPECALSKHEQLGHHEQGGTIAVHSLSVSRGHQKKGLGTILMKAYIQRIKDSKIADRVALIARDHLVKFYEGFGFINMGGSSCAFGGDGWNNMILPLEDFED